MSAQFVEAVKVLYSASSESNRREADAFLGAWAASDGVYDDSVVALLRSPDVSTEAKFLVAQTLNRRIRFDASPKTDVSVLADALASALSAGAVDSRVRTQLSLALTFLVLRMTKTMKSYEPLRQCFTALTAAPDAFCEFATSVAEENDGNVTVFEGLSSAVPEVFRYLHSIAERTPRQVFRALAAWVAFISSVGFSEHCVPFLPMVLNSAANTMKEAEICLVEMAYRFPSEFVPEFSSLELKNLISSMSTQTLCHLIRASTQHSDSVFFACASVVGEVILPSALRAAVVATDSLDDKNAVVSALESITMAVCPESENDAAVNSARSNAWNLHLRALIERSLGSVILPAFIQFSPQVSEVEDLEELRYYACSEVLWVLERAGLCEVASILLDLCASSENSIVHEACLYVSRDVRLIRRGIELGFDSSSPLWLKTACTTIGERENSAEEAQSFVELVFKGLQASQVSRRKACDALLTLGRRNAYAEREFFASRIESVLLSETDELNAEDRALLLRAIVVPPMSSDRLNRLLDFFASRLSKIMMVSKRTIFETKVSLQGLAILSSVLDPSSSSVVVWKSASTAFARVPDLLQNAEIVESFCGLGVKLVDSGAPIHFVLFELSVSAFSRVKPMPNWLDVVKHLAKRDVLPKTTSSTSTVEAILYSAATTADDSDVEASAFELASVLLLHEWALSTDTVVSVVGKAVSTLTDRDLNAYQRKSAAKLLEDFLYHDQAPIMNETENIITCLLERLLQGDEESEDIEYDVDEDFESAVSLIKAFSYQLNKSSHDNVVLRSLMERCLARVSVTQETRKWAAPSLTDALLDDNDEEAFRDILETFVFQGRAERSAA